MPFNIQKLENHSSSGHGPRVFSYKSTADTLAVVAASAYFNLASTLLLVGDFIMVSASDIDALLTVATVNTTTGLVTTKRLGATTLLGSKTFDFPSLIDGAQATTTVTVTGAVLGDQASATLGVSQALMILHAYVSAADTVTVILQNESGGTVDLASTTLTAIVRKV